MSPLRILGLAGLAIALTTVFLIARFPYDALARGLAVQAEERAGVRLQIGQIGPGPGGVTADNVRAELHNGEVIALESLRIRPALSINWLRGAPTLYLDLDAGEAGSIEGVLSLGAIRSWDGTLHGIDLSALPLQRLSRGLSLTGRVDASADVSMPESAPVEGSLQFSASDGSIQAAGMPAALPFQTFRGNIALGGEHYAEVQEMTLKGPALSASLSGTVAHSPQPGAEALDLKLQLTVAGGSFRPFVTGLGIALANDGSAELQLTGTLSRPTFR